MKKVAFSLAMSLAAMFAFNSSVSGQCDFDVTAFKPYPMSAYAAFGMVTYDDGSGPALVLGGDFYPESNIRRWNGRSWSAMGQVSFYPGSFVVFNGELYCAVYGFNVVKWNGSDWVGFGDGLAYYPAGFAIFDDGSGNGTSLYAAANDKLYRLAFDTWTHVALFDGSVQALEVFDDGNGAALYAGGAFTSVNGVDASKVARWDGATWAALGTGVVGTVRDLIGHEFNGESALFAVGAISQAGTVAAADAAVWDGQSWSALPPTGLQQPSINEQTSIGCLARWDDGTGDSLYAVAVIESLSSGDKYGNLIKWDGTSWLHIATAYYLAGSIISDLHVHDDNTGVGSALFVSGKFVSLGGIEASRLARLVPGGILPQPGAPNGAVGSALAFAVYDDGSGKSLYVGGNVTTGTLPANGILRWNGSEWSNVGGGVHGRGWTPGVARALAVFDDGLGSGEALYAAGAFAIAGDQAANNIARWDGQAWTPLGDGLTLTAPNSSVNALCVHDDGSGAMLYAGGDFTHAGGAIAANISRWDGEAWWPVGGGVDGPVRALAVFDDGSGAGPAPYAGGNFSNAGGQYARGLAKWDGQAWMPIGNLNSTGWIGALRAFDDGINGPALYAGGRFTSINLEMISDIARWNGQTWFGMGDSVAAGVSDVLALHEFDDGSGPALYVGNGPGYVGSPFSGNLTRWNGSHWATLVNYKEFQAVHALCEFNSELYIGGNMPAFGKWSETGGALGVASQTSSTEVDYGQNTALNINASHGGAVSYQWRLNGVPLSNSLHYSGVNLSRLTIQSVNPSDAGTYTATMTNDCTTITSQPITLSVTGTCDMDIAPGDGDGFVGAADLLLVINNWGATGDNPADVTGNGVVNQQDLQTILWLWGPCQ